MGLVGPRSRFDSVRVHNFDHRYPATTARSLGGKENSMSLKSIAVTALITVVTMAIVARVGAVRAVVGL